MNKLEHELLLDYLEQLELKAQHSIVELQVLQRHVTNFKSQLIKREVAYKSLLKVTEPTISVESQPPKEHEPNSFIRIKDVIEMVGLSRSSIYKYVSEGEFPSPIKLSERSVAWRRGDIDAWVMSKLSQIS